MYCWIHIHRWCVELSCWYADTQLGCAHLRRRCKNSCWICLMQRRSWLVSSHSESQCSLWAWNRSSSCRHSWASASSLRICTVARTRFSCLRCSKATRTIHCSGILMDRFVIRKLLNTLLCYCWDFWSIWSSNELNTQRYRLRKKKAKKEEKIVQKSDW